MADPNPTRNPIPCRAHCAACCIAPSISSPIPGMPNGKPAGVPCVQLTDDHRCAIFDRPERPACCAGLQPSLDMCGTDRDAALSGLIRLEAETRPEQDINRNGRCNRATR